YLDAVEREGGRRGRLLALGALDGMLPPLWELRPGEFPLVGPVLERATGVVVHSREAESRVRACGYSGPVRHVPLAAELPAAPVEPVAIAGSPVLLSVGVLNRAKRVPQLLEAFARLRRSHPDAALVLAGPGGEALQLEARAERAGLRLGCDVLTTGYIDESRLAALLAAADLSISLRWPTLGEASASALNALAHGLPLVVSDVGWFAELPSSVAAKVPVDEHEVEYLAAVLDLLAADARLRERLGAAGREHVRREHGVERAADGYVAALEDALGAGPQLRASA
ncbi:MAG: glycosyltransferase, partial [Actinomycetota bacterium]|nr:glycosyltransferase [Actinomycetota bacterium]